jgi:DNA-directed DNA polymerase III PolC
MLVPLHAKSYYSLGYGTASPADLVERAAAQGLPALALTDLDSLAGQPLFHEHCAREGVRAITGLELRRRPPTGRGPGTRAGRIVLLARDRSGYSSLCRIVSLRRGGAGTSEEQAATRDPVRAVAAHPAGLYVMTDDPRTLGELLAAPGVEQSSLRALIVRPTQAREAQAQIVAMAVSRRVPLVADPEVAMLDAGDHALHVLLAAIHCNRPVGEIDPVYRDAAMHWQRAPQSNAALYADLPQAVAEAGRIADACRFELRAAGPVLPGADAFGGTHPARLLAERCHAALREARAAGRCLDAAYAERLAAELDIIGQFGYAAYFLLAAEIAAAARRKNIPLTPRGSAVASLVIHLLGVSPLDPVAHGLYFERFLHTNRQTPPDIDLDVCSRRRDVLLLWMRRRFGREQTAMVGAHQGFGLRLALRLGLKALGTAPKRAERLCALLESRRELQLDGTRHELESSLPEMLFPVPERRLVPLIRRLVGIPRQLAMHPGGLVVADGRLDDRVPVEAAKRGLAVTQYDLRGIRLTGLMKLDVLGNRFLSQLVETTALVTSMPPAECIATIPLDARATLERIDRADTIGCYQLETPAMRALLRRLHIRSMEDCVAALALVRPGAAAGTAKRDFVRRVRGEQAIEPVHPVIAARLNRTHGLLLYDEDLMDVLSLVGGISRGAAEAIRTAIIDASTRLELRRVESDFVAAAIRHGSAPELVRSAWQTAVKFAAYSFSRAHAWSHGLLAWQAAWLKSQHLLEFGCALLNDYGGAYPLRTIGADVARAGVALLPPSINESALACTVVPDGPPAIRIGLSRIKHLARRSATSLLARRSRGGPYPDLEALCRNFRLTHRELRALVLCGACDGLPPLSPSAYPLPHEAFIDAIEQGGSIDQAAAAAARLEHALDETPDQDRTRAWQGLVRIRNELDLMDLHPSGHPMALLRSEARRLGCVASGELAARARHDGQQRTRFAGIVAASRRHRPHGEGRRELYYLTLEDEEGLVETIIPPPAYPRLAPRVTTPGPYIVEGTLEEDYGHVYMVIGELLPFYDRDRLSPD